MHFTHDTTDATIHIDRETCHLNLYLPTVKQEIVFRLVLLVLQQIFISTEAEQRTRRHSFSITGDDGLPHRDLKHLT